MQAPMVGSWKVHVHDVRPFTIHSDLYYELHVTRPEEPATMLALRVPQHAVDGEPKRGESFDVTFLMGQVTGAKRV